MDAERLHEQSMSDIEARLSGLSPAKRALLEKLLLANSADSAQATISPQPVGTVSTLSHAENRLWFVDQLQRDDPFYNMPLAARLSGNLDQTAFESAVSLVVSRHDALRTTYHLVDGEPQRQVHDSLTVTPEWIDHSDTTESTQRLEAELRSKARQTFDLEKGPLLRAIVYRIAPDEHVLLLVMHHIISDGWSMIVMLRELTDAYDAFCQGDRPSLTPLPIQYSDFAYWQKDHLTDAALEQQMAFWREQLADAPDVLDLPTDNPRPAVQDFEGATVELELSADLTSRVNQLAAARGTTPFATLLAAQALLLGRYARQDDLILGTASAGRSRAEIESLIGFFVNTLAIRVQLGNGINFGELIDQVHETVTEAHEHADVPFEQLVNEIAAGRDRSYSPIFQAALVLQNLPRDFGAGQNIAVQPVSIDNGTAKYDVTFFLWQEGDRLTGHVEYRTTLFTQASIRRMIASFETLLDEAVRSPDVSTDALPLLSKSEQAVLLRSTCSGEHTGNDETSSLMHHLFTRHVQSGGKNAAVVHNDRSITYQELDEKSDRFAAALVARGIGLEDAVVVCLPRSIELVTIFLGILKAGGAFVPVDPSYPQQRIDAIQNETSASIVVDQKVFDELELQSRSLRFAAPQIDPQHLAYIIFTSGSTGAAKGVQIEHHSIVNFVNAQIDRMGVTATDRVGSSFSPAFDGGLSEIFLALGSGATCVVNDSALMQDPARLTEHFNRHAITIAKFAPALLSMLDATAFPHLRVIASAGDKLTGELASRWVTPERVLFNGYGPTEAAVGCCMMEVTQSDTIRPPIGRPMNNMSIYLLDANQNLVPIGGKGEIYVGGPGVARGYLNRPELNSQAFLPDPFSHDANARMYRTGDLGRWRNDGMLEFIGRVDDQISLRGFRVEPGEIAAAIETCPQVQQAVVVQRTDGEQEQLVAYVVPRSEHGTNDPNLESQHVSGWNDLFQQAHRAAPVVLNPDFNISGWVSAYTNKPIPESEMRPWVESATNRILSLEPKNVLEIGCGTGLLLLEIAPHCQSYVGTDLLQSSLDNIELALQKRPEIAKRVTLHQQLADQFDALGSQTFDTIILNSVAQYFPSADYFLRVIEGAINHLAPGGCLFVGDIRNFDLQKQLATSIELATADGELSIERFKNQIQTRIEHEEELLISPSLFSKMLGAFPRLSTARVLLKDTDTMNELSRYRYDVILTADQPADCIEFETLDSLSPAAVLKILANRSEGALRISGLPNPRVAHDCRAVEILTGDESIQTVGELRSILDETTESPDPNEYSALEAASSFRVDCRWSNDSLDSYDVLFTPKNTSTHPATADKQAPTPDDPIKIDLHSLANQPLSSRAHRQLTQQLRDELREQLPAFMIPSAFVVMDELPTTVNGKVDRKALPPPVGRPSWAGNFVAPRNETEQAVAEIWEDLLDVRPVGVKDDFFDLGGHSMLAVRMIAEIDMTLGRQLPLGALFQDPTVAHLANMIEQGDDDDSASTLVTLRQVDSQQNQQTGTRSPLYCIHPAGGTVFCYLELAKHLSGDRSVLGLQARGIDGLYPPHDSLIEMAGFYADAIQQHASKQSAANIPLHIAGWSLGGNIAYEVARQLKDRGLPVGVVALLDSGLLSPETELTEEDFLPLLGALFPGAMNVPLEELRQQEPAKQLDFFVQRAATAGLIPTKEFDRAGNVLSVFQSNVKAVHQYQADSFDGDVHLFRPADQAKTSSLFDDPVLGWQQFVRKVTTLQVPGDHAHMLQSPAVEALACELSRILENYEANCSS